MLSSLHLPFLTIPVRTTISLRAGIDWNALDEISQAQRFHTPVLLFQGTADPLVPPADSERFASTLPGLVTYVPVAQAGHIESWNVDPSGYAAHLRAFLTPLVKPRR